ncbi:acylneuraminate cytidylyltransferase family protein [bacterium (Candidatus Torokbacteria) CG09_land_8_20_14_0_10_42_11]|nr:MAG: acylneuraminate cytidylyltransferase family protein [bacterium (Candidatus Torokbacteria) CG09_land_8_20_14_0_10_42_11]
MYKKHQILAIIPSRGGSESVPHKNIHPLLGKPLIYYTISEAKKSKYIDRLICSTDDPQIAKIAKKYGAETPFLRPASLAKNASQDLGFYRHTLTYLAKNENYTPDLVINLRPTAPLRTAKHIDQAIKIVVDNNADGLKTVALTDKHPHKMWRIRKGIFLDSYLKTAFRLKYGPDVPRQKLSPVYWQNAVIDITRPKFILEQNRVFGKKLATLIMSSEDSVDLDSILDFKVAEQIMKERGRE